VNTLIKTLVLSALLALPLAVSAATAYFVKEYRHLGNRTRTCVYEHQGEKYHKTIPDTELCQPSINVMAN
jgi:hypothetical protein